MTDCKQVAVPDPQLVRDAYLRQILIPLRENQRSLAQCIQGYCTGTQGSTPTPAGVESAKFPVRPPAAADFTAVQMPGSANTVGAGNASGLPSVVALANANKVVVNTLVDLVNQLIAQQNALIQDRDAMAEQVAQLQAQFMLLIKKVNS